jgi:hypothetical protein
VSVTRVRINRLSITVPRGASTDAIERAVTRALGADRRLAAVAGEHTRDAAAAAGVRVAAATQRELARRR